MDRLMRNGSQTMENFPKQGSIYWFDPELSRGAEFRKIRPCVIVSPDEMNKNIKTVIIVPLTSTIRSWNFRLKITIVGHESSRACDQICSIDKGGLKGRLGSLKSSDTDRLLTLLQTILS